MKLSTLKEVEKLTRIQHQCMDALEAAANTPEDFYEKDSGGVPGFENGFWGQFCANSDGSGWKMDLNGTYVAEAVVDAIQLILEAQIAKVNDRLIELGVDPHG